MATVVKSETVTLQELVISSLAQTDALSKLLIERYWLEVTPLRACRGGDPGETLVSRAWGWRTRCSTERARTTPLHTYGGAARAKDCLRSHRVGTGAK